MTDIICENCMVEKKITWINPEYKMPEMREELYLIIFSGKSGGAQYKHAIATAYYFEDGWWIPEAENVQDLVVHYYADVRIPEDAIEQNEEEQNDRTQ